MAHGTRLISLTTSHLDLERIGRVRASLSGRHDLSQALAPALAMSEAR